MAPGSNNHRWNHQNINQKTAGVPRSQPGSASESSDRGRYSSSDTRSPNDAATTDKGDHDSDGATISATASAAEPASDSDSLFEKTRMCRHFMRGECFRDKDCRFAHDVLELRVPQDLTRTKMCPHLTQTGKCPQSRMCRYAHRYKDLRVLKAVPEQDIDAGLFFAEAMSTPTSSSNETPSAQSAPSGQFSQKTVQHPRTRMSVGEGTDSRQLLNSGQGSFAHQAAAELLDSQPEVFARICELLLQYDKAHAESSEQVSPEASHAALNRELDAACSIAHEIENVYMRQLVASSCETAAPAMPPGKFTPHGHVKVDMNYTTDDLTTDAPATSDLDGEVYAKYRQTKHASESGSTEDSSSGRPAIVKKTHPVGGHHMHSIYPDGSVRKDGLQRSMGDASVHQSSVYQPEHSPETLPMKKPPGKFIQTPVAQDNSQGGDWCNAYEEWSRTRTWKPDNASTKASLQTLSTGLPSNSRSGKGKTAGSTSSMVEPSATEANESDTINVATPPPGSSSDEPEDADQLNPQSTESATTPRQQSSSSPTRRSDESGSGSDPGKNSQAKFDDQGSSGSDQGSQPVMYHSGPTFPDGFADALEESNSTNARNLAMLRFSTAASSSRHPGLGLKVRRTFLDYDSSTDEESRSKHLRKACSTPILGSGCTPLSP